MSNKKEVLQRVGAINSSKTWEHACVRLGLQVVRSTGKGSHCCVWKPNCEPGINIQDRILTVVKKVHRIANVNLFKDLKKRTDFSEEEILKALGV